MLKKNSGFKRSTRCESHTCLEVALDETSVAPASVMVRDSKQLEANEILSFSPAAWKAFTATI